MSKKTLKKLSQSDGYKIIKMIEANGSIIDGLWSYNDGWSDRRVALELGFDAASVQYRRREIFGELARPKPATPEAEIATLKETIDDQGRTIEDLLERVLALEEAQTRPAPPTNGEEIMGHASNGSSLASYRKDGKK